MTTVATDGKSMAGDSQCGNPTIHCEVRKIQRAKDGALLGICGQAFDLAGFLLWYECGMSGEPNVSADFEGLILLPSGVAICVDEKGRKFEHAVPAAVGSGASVAYGAMDHGATPTEAVAIAIKRDAGSGGPVQTEFLKPVLEAVA